MVNNGSLTYDHDKDGTLTQLAGCEAKFRNIDYDTYLSIRYESDVLTVSTDIENKGQWKQCFSAAGVKLPTGYYFGASAETGDLSDNHDVFSFKFYEITPTNVRCDFTEFFAEYFMNFIALSAPRCCRSYADRSGSGYI